MICHLKVSLFASSRGSCRQNNNNEHHTIQIPHFNFYVSYSFVNYECHANLTTSVKEKMFHELMFLFQTDSENLISVAAAFYTMEQSRLSSKESPQGNVKFRISRLFLYFLQIIVEKLNMICIIFSIQGLDLIAGLLEEKVPLTISQNESGFKVIVDGKVLNLKGKGPSTKDFRFFLAIF